METLLQGSLLLQDTDVAEATEVAEATVHLDMVVGLSHSAPHHDHPGPHVAHFGGHSDSVDQDSVHEVSVIMIHSVSRLSGPHICQKKIDLTSGMTFHQITFTVKMPIRYLEKLTL